MEFKVFGHYYDDITECPELLIDIIPIMHLNEPYSKKSIKRYYSSRTKYKINKIGLD